MYYATDCHISAKSQGQTQVSSPLNARDENVGFMGPLKNNGFRMKKKKILYIEDDTDIADIVVEIMRFEEYEVIIDNGKLMYKHLKEHDIGLILMDEGLSWCWGSTLCKELRERDDTAHIPIIMISAVREIDDIAQHCGANAYIRKPFEIYDIIDAVNQYYPKADPTV
ncbi:two-component system, OmpR family, alkaline phosphatase synthesis response regulator PhoP [Parapedobacter composti]|uniref:Two-component system, OmpR family, alkaline phosphatase synthesis response regulator PhoP n=1 Tax=Parapedobacter composti TaxID=623281 RepID=A0A1I1ECM7_9SPHI|nr:response regulator [Parapedobacter composti]SFB84835.1 two-component system, OmpR family, alkaline phosphatase synthesis response regulator PhoP [Parapedobacter composti]